MPPDVDIGGGYVIRLTAIDPTSGAEVTGVKVQNFAMLIATEPGVDPGQFAVGPYMLVPGPGG